MKRNLLEITINIQDLKIVMNGKSGNHNIIKYIRWKVEEERLKTRIY